LLKDCPSGIASASVEQGIKRFEITWRGPWQLRPADSVPVAEAMLIELAKAISAS